MLRLGPIIGPSLAVALVALCAGCGDGLSAGRISDAGLADVSADAPEDGPSDLGSDTLDTSDDLGALDARTDVSDVPARVDVGADVDPDDVSAPDIAVDAPPTELAILSVTPARGSVAGGTLFEVELTTRVDDDTVLMVGGHQATELRVLTATRVEAISPPGVPGPADVKIVTADDDATSRDAFYFFEPLRIDSVSPNRSPTGGGEFVEIAGAAMSEDVELSFGGRAAIAVTVLDPTRLVAYTPPHTAGTVDVRATDLDSSAVAEGFSYGDRVTIDEIVPSAGPLEGGNLVTLVGEGYTEATVIRFGGLQATEVHVLNDEHLEVLVPPGQAGPADVEALGPLGVAGRPGGYTYVDSAATGLALVDVAPGRGAAAGGEFVTLSGAGFDADNLEVRFGSARAVLVDISDSALRVKTPPGTVGPVDVTVQNDNGEVTASAGYTYLVTLEVTDILPNHGPADGGTEVVIRGLGFSEGTTFHLGPMAVEDVAIESPTSARGFTPPGSLGLADVTVNSADQEHTLDDGFRFTGPAAISSFYPPRGSIAGGTLLTIRGRGFTTPVSVGLGTEACGDVVLIDQATITCRTPPGMEGAVEVHVDLDDASLAAPERYIYFNPASRFGGAWGGHVDGAVNVSVYSIAGEAVADAFVMLSLDSDGQYQGLTNAEGLITFSGDNLGGTQLVTAAAAGYSSASVQTVDAENITILLFPTAPPASGGGGGETPLGTVTGRVDGFQKIVQPGPGERQIIIVETTRESPSRSNPWPGEGNVLDANGDRTYTLTSRIGDVAIVAVGGIINDNTGEFTPYALGLAHYVFVVPDEVITVDLTLSMNLDQPLRFKLDGVALGDQGPDINRVFPWVDLGFEGVFGGWDYAEGRGDTIVAWHQARLEGELAEARYYVYGGSQTCPNWGGEAGDTCLGGSTVPYSLSALHDVTDVDALIEMPQLIGTPQPLVPAADGIIDNGFVSFQPMSTNLPDFWEVQIYQLPATQVWEFTFPGDQTWFHLPNFPDFSTVPPGEQPQPYAYSGQLLMILTGARIADFDYNQHEYLTDLRSPDSWQSWTRQSYYISFPQ